MSRANCERPCELNTLAAKLEGSHGFLTKDSDKIKDIEAALCAECLTEDDVRKIIEEYLPKKDQGLDKDYSGTGWYKATDTGIVYNKGVPEGEMHIFEGDPVEYLSVYTKENARLYAERAATSNMTDMDYLFNLNKKFNADISHWDTSGVTTMMGLFYGASAFNQDISGWDVSNVTEMRDMFSGASAFNQDLSSWCVSKITERPYDFDYDATSWTLPKPVWGTCPGVVYA